MAERPKLLYIIVVEDVESEAISAEGRRIPSVSFRYTRPVLQSTLQFIGCKARHAFKVRSSTFAYMHTNLYTHIDMDTIQIYRPCMYTIHACISSMYRKEASIASSDIRT